MIRTRINEGELVRQADVARALGSPFVARVLEAGQRQLHRAPATSEIITTWPGDPARAALAMRFNGALHALARRGAVPSLSCLYVGQRGDFDGPIGEALACEDQFVAAWMRRTPQTNEVGRAAAVAAALMVARREWGMPFELLELGSSAGLNLNLARYAYDLGGTLAGDANSPVRIRPVWTGAPASAAAIDVAAARGVDLDPLDPADETTCERLLAYVWADQPDRADRLERAIAMARRHPPQVDRGNAAPWIEQHLAARQDEGVCRVVMHSMLMQYLGAEERTRVTAAIADAGARATKRAPLVRISYEWNAARTDVVLRMTSWPDGTARDLARCHPYATWIAWGAA